MQFKAPRTLINLFQHPAIIIAWIIGLCGMIANVTLLITIWKRYQATFKKGWFKKELKTVELYIINLVFVDILGATYLLIIAVANTVYDVHDTRGKLPSSNFSNIFTNNSKPVSIVNRWGIHPLCNIARFLYFLSLTMSVLITLLIAIERWLVVLGSLKTSEVNRTRARVILILCWLFCIGKALYPFIRSIVVLDRVKNQTRSNLMLCLLADPDISNVRYFNTINLNIFYISYVLCILIYMLLLIKMHQARKITLYNSKKPQVILAKTMALITVCNLFSNLPITIIIICRMRGLTIVFNPNFTHASAICIVLMFVSTISNPIIYINRNHQTTNRSQRRVRMRKL
ncbi:G-protein coupled receptor GRL101-like protein [Trichoplax sp. H2]|nr:G-protein coupled receptor GRL101-like protein [Trichoplax sp. H2]|eukprot:RDD47559.1 G-protein coupled receptor GRL101-like protein [Trichoplax sp. H2]